MDNRTHRKVSLRRQHRFTGGVGIAEQWEGDARNPNAWRDTHFQVEGPVVQGLQAAFLDNWVETGQTVREDGARLICAEALKLISKSQIQVIKTPYMVTPPTTQKLLKRVEGS